LTVPSIVTSFTSTSTPATFVSISTTYTTTSPTVDTLVFTSVISTTSTATTTTTLTTTTTTVAASAVPTPTYYYLVANYPASDAGNTRIYGTVGSGLLYYFIDVILPSTKNALNFTIDPTTGAVGAINPATTGKVAYYNPNFGLGVSKMYIASAGSAAAGGLVQLSCSVDTSNNFDCLFGTQPAAFWICQGQLQIVPLGYDFTQNCGTAPEQISLSVQPA